VRAGGPRWSRGWRSKCFEKARRGAGGGALQNCASRSTPPGLCALELSRREARFCLSPSAFRPPPSPYTLRLQTHFFNRYNLWIDEAWCEYLVCLLAILPTNITKPSPRRVPCLAHLSFSSCACVISWGSVQTLNSEP